MKVKKLKSKINKDILLFSVSISILSVLICASTLVLVFSCRITCDCLKNILISLATGILSSLIVTFVVGIYEFRERRQSKTIFIRHFSVVYAQGVWYLKYIVKIVCVTINVNLNLLCFSMEDIDNKKFEFSKTYQYLRKFFEMTDKRMGKLIDDFASRKFNLSDRYEDMFVNYFKSYNNLKNYIDKYYNSIQKKIENYNKDFKKLFNEFIKSINAFSEDLKKNNLNDELEKEYFSSAENYIEKWVGIDKNLDILLDKNDFNKIYEVV